MFAYLPSTYLYVAVNRKQIKYRVWTILLMSVMLSYNAHLN